MREPAFTAEELRALELIGSPAWVFDLDRQETYWANRAALELFDAPSLESLRARQRRDPMSEGALRRLAVYRQRFALGEVVKERWTFYPEGRPPVAASCRCSGLHLEGAGGRRRAMLVQAELAPDRHVDATEARLVEALRHCNELISLYTLDGEALARNPAAEAALGRIEGAKLGDRLLDEDARDRALDAVRAGEVFRAEVPVATATGPTWQDTEARRVVDPVTGERAALVVQHDVTARREAAQQLREARRHAEAESQAKSSFLAVMSHELRTPMMGVLAAAELLRESALDPDQREALEMVFAAGRQMVDLVDDVLDISRLEAGRLPIRLAPTDLRETLEISLRPFASVARAKGVELTLAVDADVPDAVETDGRRLAQIVGNLVTNAIKFTDEGEVSVRVGASTTGADRVRLAIEVRDTGMGMDPARVDDLFQPFTQADSSASRSQGGAGLGLHIVRSLAEMLGGRIEVVTAPGAGTAVEVSLPAVRVATPTRPEPEPAAPRPLALRVLLADDNALNRRALARVLRRWGCEVLEAADGEEALAVTESQRPDVVLMDVWMPGVDGPTAARRLRGRADALAETPIIALSADAFYPEREGETSPFDRFLHKPVDWPSLRAALDALTG